MIIILKHITIACCIHRKVSEVYSFQQVFSRNANILYLTRFNINTNNSRSRFTGCSILEIVFESNVLLCFLAVHGSSGIFTVADVLTNVGKLSRFDINLSQLLYIIVEYVSVAFAIYRKIPEIGSLSEKLLRNTYVLNRSRFHINSN